MQELRTQLKVDNIEKKEAEIKDLAKQVNKMETAVNDEEKEKNEAQAKVTKIREEAQVQEGGAKWGIEGGLHVGLIIGLFFILRNTSSPRGASTRLHRRGYTDATPLTNISSPASPAVD